MPLQQLGDDVLTTTIGERTEREQAAAEMMDAVPDDHYNIVETPLADHHLLILQALEDMVMGRLIYDRESLRPIAEAIELELHPVRAICRRVMLMFPPGSAKSTYASVVFPTWCMGKWPHLELILTGYGDVICKRHGKRARQICNGPRFSSVFGNGIDPNTRAADDWQLVNGSSYKSSGILSGITGFRCGGLIWDDITKGRKEADSETIRHDTYMAYIDDARSRKTPGSWEVGIGTRWHEDETMGRILPAGYNGESGFLSCRDGNVWLVLCVPAECERDDDPLEREIGEMLWPDWFDPDYWVDKRINPRSWASLYQQRPAPDTGLYFKRKWMKTYENVPAGANYYIAFDPAVTSAEDNAEADDTCIQVWAVDQHARIYLVDEWIDKCTMDVWVEQLVTMISIYHPLEVVSEAGVIRRAAEPYIMREQQQRGIFAIYEWVTRNADKAAMARAYQAMCAAGQVYFPSTSIGDNNVDELLRFPTSKDDHRVDAGANLCLRLEAIWAANPPDQDKEPPPVMEHGFKISSIMPDRYPKKRSRWASR